jgi:WD40 repeat protein
LDTRRTVDPIVLQQPDAVASVALSDDGDQVVAGATNGTVRVWSLHAPRRPREVDKGSSAARAVAFGPKRKQLAAGFEDGSVRFSDGADVTVLAKGEPGAPLAILALTFAPDGASLAFARGDGTVVVATLEPPRGTRELLGDGSPARQVSFASDSSRVAAGYADGTIQIFELERADFPTRLKGHTDAVISLAFDAAGDRLISASADGTARVWDLKRPAAEPLALRDTPPLLAAGFGPLDGKAMTVSETAARPWRLVERPALKRALQAVSLPCLTPDRVPDFLAKGFPTCPSEPEGRRP